MNPSKRHHFIPQFLLKNFTNERGKFYIYLVKEDRFKENEKLFSPKQQFYENFGNRTFIGSKVSFFIENEFSKLDSKVGSILHKCKSHQDKIIGNEWMILQHFVDMMFWRNPANEALLKVKIKNARYLSELGLSDDKRSLDLNQINSDEGIYKYIRLLMPMKNEIIDKKPSNIFLIRYRYKTIFGTNLPNLIGDNPVIYKQQNLDNLHNEQFIFPLAPALLVMRTTIKDIAVWKEVRLLLDMLQIAQAREYVAVTNSEYPALLRKFFEKNFDSVAHLRQTVFDHIFERSKIKLEKDILYDKTCRCTCKI